MVFGTFPSQERGTTRGTPPAVFGNVDPFCAASDYEGVGLEGHAAEELLAGTFDGVRRDEACRGVETEIWVAHEGGELGVVWGADINVWEGIGGV